jgi:hypothetical protein
LVQNLNSLPLSAANTFDAEVLIVKDNIKKAYYRYQVNKNIKNVCAVSKQVKAIEIANAIDYSYQINFQLSLVLPKGSIILIKL